MTRTLSASAGIALLSAVCATPLPAQGTEFDPPPRSPFRFAIYVASAEHGTRTAPGFGLQIELPYKYSLFPFVGSLDSQLGQIFEVGLGSAVYLGPLRPFVGASFAARDLSTTHLGLRAGVDIPISRLLGLRPEVRNYDGEDWTYAIGATVPSFRKPKKED